MKPQNLKNKTVHNPVGPMWTPEGARPDSNRDISSKNGRRGEPSECSVAETQKWPPMLFTLGHLLQKLINR